MAGAESRETPTCFLVAPDADHGSHSGTDQTQEGDSHTHSHPGTRILWEKKGNMLMSPQLSQHQAPGKYLLHPSIQSLVLQTASPMILQELILPHCSDWMAALEPHTSKGLELPSDSQPLQLLLL